jgi:hypothetical protein
VFGGKNWLILGEEAADKGDSQDVEDADEEQRHNRRLLFDGSAKGEFLLFSELEIVAPKSLMDAFIALSEIVSLLLLSS